MGIWLFQFFLQLVITKPLNYQALDLEKDDAANKSQQNEGKSGGAKVVS